MYIYMHGNLKANLGPCGKPLCHLTYCSCMTCVYVYHVATVLHARNLRSVIKSTLLQLKLKLHAVISRS